ncbi:MAG: baseplate J/gp47 family protein [Pyrinomonadaceae bacterium]
MPLTLPNLDSRRYQELRAEALARIPVHNPEWTNFNQSDPGVTLVELFAFMTENLLYRCNQIPERNRLKFLSLLGLQLRPASSARGLVAFTNERGPLETITLNDGLEVRAGQVPFRTERGLDVLPIDAQVYFKRKIENADQPLKDYYKLLYASYQGTAPDETDFQLYETVPLDARLTNGVAIGQETADDSLWVALLLRSTDNPAEDLETARAGIGGKTISLGIVPTLEAATRQLAPGGLANPEGQTLLQYQIPNIPASGLLPLDKNQRVPQYTTLPAVAPSDVLAAPGVVEITLPQKEQLILWSNLDPLEPGVGDFPPALEDTKLNDRLITWLRIRATGAVRARLLWVGINSTLVTQRARVANELLPNGTGAPDQTVRVSRTPVLPDSVRLTVTTNNETRVWREIDDLMSAGPEVPTMDARLPPGSLSVVNPLVEVYTINAEAGEIRFGDGTHGKRPPTGAAIRASYDYGMGIAGNVGAGSIKTSPALPAGLKVTNPVRTWGGAEAETVAEGEKQIARYLQHRDRLVNAADFATITLRTPGVDIGRVDVIPAYTPTLTQNEPGDAAGAVTLMVIPRNDPKRPDAPLPDRLFLDALCRYLEPRRLITTEVFLRGPVYKDVWISVGINVLAGVSPAPVREAVKQALLQFLAPLPASASVLLDNQAALLTTPQYADTQRGWPLRKPVTDRELLAVASRVPGVLLVNDVKIAEGTKAASAQIPMTGLELPRVAGISVSIGDPVDLDQLRGQGAVAQPQPGGKTPPRVVPVPVIPEEC